MTAPGWAEDAKPSAWMYFREGGYPVFSVMRNTALVEDWIETPLYAATELSHLCVSREEFDRVLKQIDHLVSNGKMGDWQLALQAIRNIARQALEASNAE